VFWNKIKKNKNEYELIKLSGATSETGTAYPTGAHEFTPPKEKE
jgi:hypothetical protein